MVNTNGLNSTVLNIGFAVVVLAVVVLIVVCFADVGLGVVVVNTNGLNVVWFDMVNTNGLNVAWFDLVVLGVVKVKVKNLLAVEAEVLAGVDVVLSVVEGCAATVVVGSGVDLLVVSTVVVGATSPTRLAGFPSSSHFSGVGFLVTSFLRNWLVSILLHTLMGG